MGEEPIENHQEADCDRDIATEARALRPRIREASRARVPDSPSAGEHKDVRTARPENNSPRKELNETHHKAEEARGNGSAGRDSRFGLARPVLFAHQYLHAIPKGPCLAQGVVMMCNLCVATHTH